MSRTCDICTKTYQKGNLVPRKIGNRVTNRSIRTQKPNLRNKRFEINGITQKVRLCASCLKRLKFESVEVKKTAQDKA